MLNNIYKQIMVAQKQSAIKRDKNNCINTGQTVRQHAYITNFLVLHIWYNGRINISYGNNRLNK